MSIRTLAYGALALAAALFGTTFVFVKAALDAIPPLSFVGWRFLIAAVVLLAVARPRSLSTWVDGSIAGGILFVGFATQTIGLEQTSASNSGLITGLYVVFTPLLASVVARRRPSVTAVVGGAVSVVGLMLLTSRDGLALSAGDAWTLACAGAFALHIVILASMAPRHRVLGFTAVQLAVTAALALAASALTGHAGFPDRSVWMALGVTAIAVTCGAFVAQVWAQTVIGPSRTAMVLALEPVFAVATAGLILGERLDVRAAMGAVLILAGIYIVLVFAPPEDIDLRTAEALSEAH
jgi:drug/metabolite transporter (DMT)-like permease